MAEQGVEATAESALARVRDVLGSALPLAGKRGDIFRAIIDNAPIGIWLLDADGRVVVVNRTFCETVGVSEAEFIAAPSYVQFFPPDVAARCLASDAAALASDGLHHSYEAIPLTDGTRHEHEILKLPLRDDAGNPSGLIGLSVDISQRKNAEERVSLLASVFENAQEGALITDAAGKIVDVNPAFCGLTGYLRGDAIGADFVLLCASPNAVDFIETVWSALRGSGRWTGEVLGRRKDGSAFTAWFGFTAVRDQSDEITRVVGIFSDITHIRNQENELRRLAHFDDLTGLPNRTLLADRMRIEIAQAKRSGRLLAVAYLDVDNFKAVNDQYGHAFGDRLLFEVAHRLGVTVRGGDTAARLGGDEFVLLLPDLPGLSQAVIGLERIMAALAEPVSLYGLDEPLKVSASIGVTLYPHDEADADTLIRHADQAMYQAKQGGRNRYVFFDADHDRETFERRERIDRLRSALDGGEFVLYYQPKVNMRTGQLLGAEALVRWEHPELGLLPPGRFLPDIENTELESALGEWVIATALAQIAEWQRTGLEVAVSVNVSANHILGGDFEAMLKRLLADRPDVAPTLLEIEVLETSALGDVLHGAEIVDACRRLGVTFALDDFGTGYSSLTHLRRLSAETLKIDQSFVSNMLNAAEDLAIVDGVIALAAAFKRTALAEGVETLTHGLVLLLLGCEQAQGYFIARPMPAATLPGWVASWRPDERWLQAPERPLAASEIAILVAEYQHEDWVRSLAESVAGDTRAGAMMLHAADCQIGHFLTSIGHLRHIQGPEFTELTTTHDRVHDAALDLLSRYDAGDAAGAKAELAAFTRLSDAFLHRLREFRRSTTP